MNAKMKAALERYEKASRASWDNEAEQRMARKAMSAACSVQKGVLKRKVQKILKQAGKDAYLERSYCWAQVDHSKRPYTVTVDTSVKLSWYEGSGTDRTHVTLELSSQWDGVDKLLETLERVVMADAGKGLPPTPERGKCTK